MRVARTRRLLAAAASVALLATACGGDGGDADDTTDDATDDAASDDVATDDQDTSAEDGEDDAAAGGEEPTITIGSFNFPESEILGEAYAQALEAADYPVERQLNLGARDLLYPELLEGEIDLVPEYLGSGLITWFEEDAPEDVDAGVEAMREAFGDEVTVLEPAPAQNSNAFVVSSDWAQENDVSTIADLADVGDITFAGPPECEERQTCYAGLQDLYGLDNVSFESVQEASARLAGLDSGDYQMILLFSTDAPLAGDELVQLEDTEGIVPPENITPVVRTEIVDAYGDDLVALLEDVTQAITTDDLQAMNAEASEGLAPAEIAGSWLEDNGLV